MKIKLMRALDTTVGGLIFFVINVFLFFKIRKSIPKIVPSQVEKVLVIKMFGLGSTILMDPMFRSIKNLYPKAKIVLLTFSENKEFCDGYMNAIDSVLPLRRDNFSNFLGDVLASLFSIWKKRPDVVVDAEFFSNFSSLFSLFTFSPVKVGFFMRFLSQRNHYTHKVSLNPHHHIMYAFDALAVALGSDYRGLNVNSLSLETPNERYFLSAIKKLNLQKNSKIIVVNPNTSYLTLLRRWPSEYFVSLIRGLIKRWNDCCFVFVGNAEEMDYVKNIVRQIDASNVHDSSGLLSIHEYLALLKSSELIITNDSLPVHVASAYNKDVVVFWGPESPNFYGPLSENSLSFFENILCSPCLQVFDNKAEIDCNENICLKKITPELALKQIGEKFPVK